jgi:hypothetical protein
MVRHLDRPVFSELDAALFKQFNHERKDAWLDGKTRHRAFKALTSESAPKPVIEPRPSETVERHPYLCAG